MPKENLDSEYFAALSISSLDSQEAEDGPDSPYIDENFRNTHMELDEKLQNLEEIPFDLLNESSKKLNLKNDVFTELIPNQYNYFSLDFKDLYSNAVFSMTIRKVPDYVVNSSLIVPSEMFYETQYGPGNTLMQFFFRNAKKDVTSVNCHPQWFTNGDCCIGINDPAILQPGKLLLRIFFPDKELKQQSVRISSQVRTVVRASPVRANEPARGCVSEGDYVYYRYIHSNPNQMINFQLRPVASLQIPSASSSMVTEPSHVGPESSSRNDLSSGNLNQPRVDLGSLLPDMFITNRFEGLVGPSKDDYIWLTLPSRDKMVEVLIDDPNYIVPFNFSASESPYSRTYSPVSPSQRSVQNDTNMTGRSMEDLSPHPSKSDEIFTIAVYGQSEFSEFELLISTYIPPAIQMLNTEFDHYHLAQETLPHEALSSEGADHPVQGLRYLIKEVVLAEDQPTFFKLSIDPSQDEDILLLLTAVGAHSTFDAAFDRQAPFKSSKHKSHEVQNLLNSVKLDEYLSQVYQMKKGFGHLVHIPERVPER